MPQVHCICIHEYKYILKSISFIANKATSRSACRKPGTWQVATIASNFSGLWHWHHYCQEISSCPLWKARSTSLQLEHPSRLQEHALLTTCFKRSWFQNRWNSVHFKQHASERLRAGGRAKNFEVPTSDPCLSVSLKTAPCATPNLAWHANSEINSEAYYPSQECGEHPW